MASATFVNNNWAQINVKGLRGNYQTCSQNAAPFSFALVRGDSKSIDFNNFQTLCYQRDLDPDNPDGNFSEYDTIENFGDCTVDL